MAGLKNGHIRKNLTQNGEPRRSSWGTQKKKKNHQDYHYNDPNYKSAKDTFFGGQLSSLPIGQQDRSGVCLEACDGLGLSCLPHHIYSLHHTQHVCFSMKQGH